jgi:hypothetical protein
METHAFLPISYLGSNVPVLPVEGAETIPIYANREQVVKTPSHCAAPPAVSLILVTKRSAAGNAQMHLNLIHLLDVEDHSPPIGNDTCLGKLRLRAEQLTLDAVIRRYALQDSGCGKSNMRFSR